VTRTLFGYSIASDRELPRAGGGPDGRGSLTIRCTEQDLLAREGDLVSWDDREGTQFGLATSGPDLLAWCSITGSFVVSGERGEIVTRPTGEPEQWEHRLGATIIPLALAERGDLALHAAAVVHAGRAVLLCGPPGRGKSTATAALALRGLRVLSEDGVVISGLHSEPVAWPGQAGVRIPSGVLAALQGGEDSNDLVKTTQLIDHAHRDGPVRVAAVIVLARLGGDAPQLERFDPVAALPALMPHVLYGGPSRLPSALTRAAALLSRVPAFRGRLPRDLSRAGEHADALIQRALD
jgi:hypothetical protein